MKAAFVKGPAQVEVRTVDKPSIGPDEIMVRMRACGVCG